MAKFGYFQRGVPIQNKKRTPNMQIRWVFQYMETPNMQMRWVFQYIGTPSQGVPI